MKLLYNKNMNTPAALYAYFGYLGDFSTDIPGHTFYQLGLIDQLCLSHHVDKVDFYSYLSHDSIGAEQKSPIWPKSPVTPVFERFTKERIRSYNLGFAKIMENIEKGRYEKIFLKARFRNLSTLTKQLTDAKQFELIITAAIQSGQANKVVILDTDLSLEPEFVEFCKSQGISFEIPSIDYPNVSKDFIKACEKVWLEETDRFERNNKVFYYGNISFGNYKAGHAKNPIVVDSIKTAADFKSFTGKKYEVSVAGKLDQGIASDFSEKHIGLINRFDRVDIWNEYASSTISLNISKDLYVDRGFFPARVYESLIFGAIPVSYKDYRIHEALGFTDLPKLEEILAFFKDSGPSDRASIYSKCISNLFPFR
jgi:hypothetical protein